VALRSFTTLYQPLPNLPDRSLMMLSRQFFSRLHPHPRYDHSAELQEERPIMSALCYTQLMAMQAGR